MRQALEIAIDYMNERLEDHDCKYQRHPATEAERINILADIETVKEALTQPYDTAKLYEELRSIIDGGSESFTHEDAVQYLKDKLAQPEHEPNSVTYKEVTEAMNALYMGDIKQVQIAMEMETKRLYTTQPQRTWVGLTDREKSNIWLESRAAIPRFHTYASLVEAKLKEKNT